MQGLNGRPRPSELAGAGWFAAWFAVAGPAGHRWGASAAAALAWGVLVVLLPFLVAQGESATQRRALRWSGSVGSLLLCFHVFAAQRGPLADYATVGWGLAAASVFLLGLFLRSRPHRLAALAGLALCVPRAFMYDLHSTLYRIAAFVALGVVLLWVGFSYHRFRHLVADDEKKL